MYNAKTIYIGPQLNLQLLHSIISAAHLNLQAQPLHHRIWCTRLATTQPGKLESPYE